MRLSLKVNNGYDFVYNYLSIDNRQPSTECSLFYNSPQNRVCCRVQLMAIVQSFCICQDSIQVPVHGLNPGQPDLNIYTFCICQESIQVPVHGSNPGQPDLNNHTFCICQDSIQVPVLGLRLGRLNICAMKEK